MLFKEQKWSLDGTKFSLSHIRELFSIKDKNKIKYYVTISEEQSLTRDELRGRIKNKEYERLYKNTKLKLINKKYPQVCGYFSLGRM